MKNKLTALLLCIAMLFSLCLLSSCSFFTASVDPDADPDTDPDTDPDADPEGVYVPPVSDYDPDDWFQGADDDYSSCIHRDANDDGYCDHCNAHFTDGNEEGYVMSIAFREKLEQTLGLALDKLDSCIEDYDGKFPGAYSKEGVYSTSENTKGWVQGFWVGSLWLAYEMSEDEAYATEAASYLESFRTRIEEMLGIDNHDMGFLYSPSCVAAYKLKGDERAKESALMAADYLLTRYHADAGFIQAWGEVGAEEEYRLIIDCLLNIPLLYWATEVTGDEKYADVADTHLASTLATIYREDGSTYHTYYFDTETKQPSHGATKQGYSDNSTWARGQSWAMYGTAIAYSYTQSADALEHFKKATDCFLARLGEDNVPCWDFDRRNIEGEPKDTSAAAIAICGILEGCKYLPDTDLDKGRYLRAAEKMMSALIDGYFTGSAEMLEQYPDNNGILLGTTQSVRAEASIEQMTPYGDYFFLEALQRMLDGGWEMYW